MPIINRLLLAWEVAKTGKTGNIPSTPIPQISEQELIEAKSFFPLEKFFIFGHARSGTTLLARLLRLHPHVHCNYQAHFFSRPPFLHSLVADPQVREWLSRRSNRWNQGNELSALVLRATADFIMERDAHRYGDNIRIVGDKSPNNLTNGEAVQLMHRIYPDAKLVYIVRDGRDAALSHRIQAFIEFPEQLSKEDRRIRNDFSKDPRSFLKTGDDTGEQSPARRSIFTEKGLRAEAGNWVRNVTGTDEAGEALYGKNYHALRYEDLLRQPWQEMSRLWAFLGVDSHLPSLAHTLEAEMSQNPDADYQQEKAADISQALTKGKRGSWKEFFTERDQLIFNEIAGDVLRKWHYL
jgi:hypothetical protein